MRPWTGNTWVFWECLLRRERSDLAGARAARASLSPPCAVLGSLCWNLASCDYQAGIPESHCWLGKGVGCRGYVRLWNQLFFFFFYFYVLRRTHAWEVWLLKCGMGGWKTHGIICRVFHSHPLMISFQNTPQLIKKAFKANRPWLLSGLDSHEKWHIFSVDSGSDGWFCSTLRWPCPSSACQNGGKSSLLCAFWLQANSVGLHHIVITAHELWSSLALELMSLSWNENK